MMEFGTPYLPGKPLNDAALRSRAEGPPKFPSPFAFRECLPVTLVELRMRQFSGKVREKASWWEKVFDADIVSKWRAEMIEQDKVLVETFWGGEKRFEAGDGEKKWPRDAITPAQLDYVFDELKHDASQMAQGSRTYPSAVPMVHESVALIPPALKAALLADVARLESVPDDEKDWHPGSNQQVLDLVHPSLYFLRIGHTRVLCGDSGGALTARVITWPEYKERVLGGLETAVPDTRPRGLPLDFDRVNALERAVSKRHQWLPTDFEVSANGRAQPLGYINNLHPIEHRKAYATISSLLERFLPLFERVVSDALSPTRPYAIQVDGHSWYLGIAEPGDDVDDDGWQEWQRTTQWPQIPDPAPFEPPTSCGRVDLGLSGRTIQVIVKLANIVLTPENPTHPGGRWHVEGMANERIVATGLYYYGCHNITESKLAFRGTAGKTNAWQMSHYHEQHDHQGCVAAWGIGRDSSLNQELGHVVAAEGKCVAFPNVYQHCVQPFELADPSKPGYRKILCFFLVDPLNKVVSTSDVLPQQESWWTSDSWSEITYAAVPLLNTLPTELYKEIISYASVGTISRAEAEERRKDFMAERSNFAFSNDRDVFEVEWNMCEH